MSSGRIQYEPRNARTETTGNDNIIVIYNI